jgi:hypothetical protein
MEGFDHDRAGQVCGVPPPFVTGLMMAIGYPTAPEALADHQREAEQRPRQRRPLSEFVFDGAWARALASSGPAD